MKNKLWFIIFIFFVISLSCEKRHENNNSELKAEYHDDIKIVQLDIEDLISNEVFVQDEKINNYHMLFELEKKIKYFGRPKDSFDEGSTFYKYNLSLLYATEINFGVQNGINIFTLWNDFSDPLYQRVLQSLCIINEGEVVDDIYIINATNPEIINKPNVFEKIPGIHFNDINCFVINDFNNDGLDEILFYTSTFGLNGDLDNLYFYICNYNFSNDYPIQQFRVKFDLVNDDDDFIPIEYCTIDGVNGFLIYTYIEDNNSKWLFYTWDKEEGKYYQDANIVLD
jgi:hypothetical protein